MSKKHVHLLSCHNILESSLTETYLWVIPTDGKKSRFQFLPDAENCEFFDLCQSDPLICMLLYLFLISDV